MVPAAALVKGCAVSARVLDGRKLAQDILQEQQRDIAAAAAPRPPGLAAVLVGADPASEVYVRNKLKACATCGIRSFFEPLPATASAARRA